MPRDRYWPKVLTLFTLKVSRFGLPKELSRFVHLDSGLDIYFSSAARVSGMVAIHFVSAEKSLEGIR